MNDRPEHGELLDDVLAEGGPAGLRAALFEQTLRLARRRRRWRRARRWGGAAAVVLLGVWLAGHDWTRKTTVRETAALITPSACRVVVTEPLGAAKVVATGSFAAVTSISSQSAVTQVATMSGEFHYIDDDRLLALAGPGAAMLVRTSRDTAELVFLESTALPSVPPRN